MQGRSPCSAEKLPKAIPDTPLFVKTHDFLLWLIRHTQRFPKNLRHSYTVKLETIGFEFQESILMANAGAWRRAQPLATTSGREAGLLAGAAAIRL